ncbi:MAG TPA: hypothetical protein VF842_03210 [Flavobacterium sp.]
MNDADLFIRAKNRQHLTNKVNGFFGLISVIIGVEKIMKMKRPIKMLMVFFAAGNLEKYNEFLEDYYKIVSVNDGFK